MAMSTHGGAQGKLRRNSAEPSRKRRRHAVVCTECRRRKIACDRSVPCAQCVQSKSSCTFYNSYHSYLDENHVRDSQRTSPLNSMSAISQTPFAQELSSQLSLSSTTDYRDPFTRTIGSSPVTLSVDAALLNNPNGSANTDVAPIPTSIYPDPNHMQTPVSLFTDMTEINGLMPILADSLICNPSSLIDSRILFHKSRVYGPSHWISLLGKHNLLDDIKDALFTGEANEMFSKCKSLARAIKYSTQPTPHIFSQSLYKMIPSKETADHLVHLYLRTFETVFSVVHVPSFEQEYIEYWNSPQATKDSILIQLLLIMAIGTCFCTRPSAAGATKTRSKLRNQSLQWIHVAHERLTSAMAKQDLSLRGVQNHCLLVLALMTNKQAARGNLVWITVGSLMQKAMTIGLHIKPSQLPVSALEAETRRRLWATILELSVQSSLDSGTFPMIPPGALNNLEPPFNLDDSQLTASMHTEPVSQPMTTFTRSSVQRALLRSLAVRLKIAEALSQLPSELDYNNVRSMGAELIVHLRETSQLIKSFHFNRPSPFQVHLQDLLARRFLFTLHVQFAHQAPSNVDYHFSRTACLESALLLLSPGYGHNPDENKYASDDDDTSSLNYYQNLRLHGDGLFKTTMLAAVIAVCAEILVQLREDSSPAVSSLLCMPLLKIVKDTASLMWCRIQSGESSIKAFVFVTCVLAKIDASRNSNSLQQKDNIDQAISNTAKRVLHVCANFLASRLDGSSNPPASMSEESHSLMEESLGLDQLLQLADMNESSGAGLPSNLPADFHSDYANESSAWLNDDTSIWKYLA